MRRCPGIRSAKVGYGILPAFIFGVNDGSRKGTLMSYMMNWEAKGVYVRFADHVDARQVDSATCDMYNHEHFDEMQYFIWDATRIKSLDMNQDDTQIMAFTDRVASSYKHFLKGAFVVEDSAVREVVRQYIELSLAIGNPWEHRLFNDEQQARTWVASAQR